MSKQIRRNDEHWQDNLLGLTFNKRLEKAIAKRHAAQVKEESRRMVSESAFVTCLQPKTNKILDIGFNRPNDLILDNFGTFIAALIRQPSTGSSPSFSLTDVTNSAQTFMIYSNAPATNTTLAFGYDNAGSTGTQIQLGSGTTAAARTNYAIQTAFGTAPENARFATGAGSYGGGADSFSGAISAGGAGTVNEMGFFAVWATTTAAAGIKTVMLFHDILSSGVAFVAGNTLNASYSITL